jgi:hypothetical protein
MDQMKILIKRRETTSLMKNKSNLKKINISILKIEIL